MRRAALLLGVSFTLFACGVKAAPRPPRPDARPQTGDPNMVRTNSPQDTAPAATQSVDHNPAFPGGLPPWQPPSGTPETREQRNVEKKAAPQTSPDNEREK